MLRWVKSSRTVCKAWVFEAEVNKDPAYLPAGVSAIDGALCPEWLNRYTCNRLSALWLGGKVKLGNKIWWLSEHHEFVVYKYKMINTFTYQFNSNNIYFIKL